MTRVDLQEAVALANHCNELQQQLRELLEALEAPSSVLSGLHDAVAASEFVRRLLQRELSSRAAGE
jgi:hypothetical protein